MLDGMSEPNAPVVTCLSIHTGYRCSRTGACCSSGWPIPVTAGQVAMLGEAIEAGTLGTGSANRFRGKSRSAALDGARAREASRDGVGSTAGRCFVTREREPSGPAAVLASEPSGDCVFLARASTLTCTIHRDLDPKALPASCRHFPRICRLEPGRTTITLSHYCPTAARMLVSAPGSVRIVPAPPALIPARPVEGLDVRDALPPLLRPDMLMSHAAQAAWERRVIDTLERNVGSIPSAMRRLAEDVERVYRWSPGEASLETIIETRETTGGAPTAGDLDLGSCLELHRLACSSVPEHLRPAPPLDRRRLDLAATRWPSSNERLRSRTVRRYLAARSFGSWYAYQGRGLRTTFRAILVALGVLTVEIASATLRAARSPDEDLLIDAVRASDLLLAHLVDPQRLADRLGALESDDVRGALGPCSIPRH